MNAVVWTGKHSYVASTKYTRRGVVVAPIAMSKMKAPHKKLLVRKKKTEEFHAKVRKGLQKKVRKPIHSVGIPKPW